MKGFIVRVVTCMLMLGLAVVAFSSPKGTALLRGVPPSANRQINVLSSLTDTIATAATEGVPLYPGAQPRMDYCRDDRPGNCLYSLSLRGSDILDKVVAFYKQTMPAKGWVLTEEGVVQDGHSMHFVWTNAEGGVPARRYLNLAVGRSSDVGSLSIILSFQRWPDPNKVPLDEAVGTANTQWRTNAKYGYLERVTNYTTVAAPDKVTAYYKDVMIQQGWWADKYDTYPGLRFLYSRGVEKSRYSRVGIDLQAQQDGQTMVEMIASGDEVVR